MAKLSDTEMTVKLNLDTAEFDRQMADMKKAFRRGRLLRDLRQFAFTIVCWELVKYLFQ